MTVMEAPALTYGCGTADASRVLRKCGRRIARQRCAIRRRASTFGSYRARPNSGELSRLLAAKMSCNRRHADVMNVGWLVSATDVIFAGAWVGNRWRAPCRREWTGRRFQLD